MKHSTKKSEIILLAVLAAAAIIIVFYKFLLLPLKEDSEILKNQVDNTDLLIRNVNNTIMGFDGTMNDLKEKYERVDTELQSFFVRTDNEAHIAFIKEILENNDINIVSIVSEGSKEYHPDTAGLSAVNPESVFSENTEEESDQKSSDDSEKESSGKSDKKDSGEEESMIPFMEVCTVQLETFGSYENTLNMIKEFSSHTKLQICDDLQISITDETDHKRMARTTMQINFIVIREMICLDRNVEDLNSESGYRLPEDFTDFSYQTFFPKEIYDLAEKITGKEN